MSVAERIDVTGVVQGVGFRPFVYRLASELGLDGFVGNDATQVFIEVRGAATAIDRLVERIESERPPLARIETVTRTRIDRTPPGGFRIADSLEAAGARTLVPPDTATCAACLVEFDDPANRRYRHPFITCTNCGPRFTIITDLPYDRPATTMADFEMCPTCRAEYEDPADRRYHAQPISCLRCGPTLRLATPTDRVGSRSEPAAGAADFVRAGHTVAVKGLGGFHLAVDATSDAAVEAVRRRKVRPDKPFAVMVADIDAARQLAEISVHEADQLRSPARPVVLLRARPNDLSELVAPGNPLIGVMLPSTPIHELLMRHGLGPLVMTSANRSGAPLVHRDDDATALLGELCDALLTHDRRIHVPCDDSVIRLVDDMLMPIRRARGFAPLPVPIGNGRRPVLAVGAELKNACCIASSDHAWMSQHLGDMENLETLVAFERSVDQMAELYGVEPAVVAVDAHPGYSTSRWARRRHPDRTVEVQHHHAHVASVMAEHELDPLASIIGIAFDGTGYGEDGTIWGGEVLVANAHGFERVAHLSPVPLPGGDAAIRHPNRVALSHLAAAGVAWHDDLAPLRALTETERNLLRRQLDRGVACVPTTSMGRLFDAVASLLDLRHEVSYEAQAAIDLEMAAVRGVEHVTPYAFAVGDGLIDQRPVITAIVDDLRSGIDPTSIARAFHVAVADAVVSVAASIRAARGLDVVALTGGVFQNALVTQLCTERLRAAGLTCLTHHLVPPNDGGLALGQAFVAAHRPEPGDTMTPPHASSAMSPPSQRH